MSKFLRKEFLVTLDISCLKLVRDALRENGVSEARWYDLGIELELGPSELDAINSDHPNASRCLLKCLEKWLKGRSNRTWEVLGRALKRMDETEAAENIRDSYGDLASQLLQKLYKGKLSDIVFSEDSTEMLHKKGLITEDEQRSLDDNNGFMTVDSLKEVLFAVAEDHEKLRTFGHILLESDEGIGSKILQCCDQLIPSHSISNQSHNAMSKVECTGQVKVVYMNEADGVVFDRFRVEFINAREKIAKSMTPLIPSCEEIKIYLRLCFPELEEKLVNVDKVEGVMNVVKIECTIINIVPMEAIADNYNCDDAKKLIEQYNKDLDCFCDNKVALVLNKNLLSPHTSLFDEITFVLDWRPDERKLKDIRRLLEKAFKDLSQRVIVKRIGDENSINIICFAPNHLLDALLLAAQDSVATLIEEFCLIRLTIGHYTVYNKAIKDKEIQMVAQEVGQANNERKKLSFLVTKKKDLRLKVEYHRTVLEVQKLRSLYNLKGNEMKQKGEIALLSSQCKEMSEEMSKMRIDLEGVAKELNEEKEQMPSKIRSELQPLKDDLALQRHYISQKEALSQQVSIEEEYDGSLKESELSHKMIRLLKDNEEFRNELKATKDEYDKRIETLSENIKAKERKLSREITRLSEENEELRSKLKATKEEYDGYFSDIVEEICQPTEPTIIVQEILTDASEGIRNFAVTNVRDDISQHFLSNLINSIKKFEEQEEELVAKLAQELKDLADKLTVTESEIIEKLTAHATALKKHCNDSEKRLCSIETCVEMQIKKQLAEYNAEKKEMKDELEALKKELKTKSENKNKERSQIKEEILRMREEMTLVTKDKDKTKEEEVGLHIKDFDDKPLDHKIKNIIEKLEDFASQIVPADVTTRQKSIIKTHSEEVQSKFVEPLLTNEEMEDQLRPTGRGPLTHKGNVLSIISDQSASQNSSTLSLDSGVILREKTTSSPSASVRMKKVRSISREDHTLLEVVWVMNDLLISLNKLYDYNNS